MRYRSRRRVFRRRGSVGRRRRTFSRRRRIVRPIRIGFRRA